jgi:hypothetical protein
MQQEKMMKALSSVLVSMPVQAMDDYFKLKKALKSQLN